MVKKATDNPGRRPLPAPLVGVEPKRLPPCPRCGGEVYWLLIVTGPHRGRDDIVCSGCGWEVPDAPPAEGGAR